jgi:putative zinc finger/helix-turn-helix YgiT family protein
LYLVGVSIILKRGETTMNKNIRQEDIQSREENATCPECGSRKLTRSQEEYRFPYGKGTDAVELSAAVEVEKCGDCGFSCMGPAAERACHEAICEHLGVMTPSQIKGLRDYHGLKQAEFSKITGLGEATLSRWERGIVIQNKAYDHYLYLLGLEGNLNSVRERTESLKPIELTSKNIKRPRFRELDVNENVLQKQDSFKLRMWEIVG